MSLFGAIDLGASSGRVLAGLFENGKLQIREIHRFANNPLTRGDRLVWDFEYLMREIQLGIRELGAHAERLDSDLISIGIDTWAVDYGLVHEGQLLRNPNCYRDPAHQLGVELVEAKLSFPELYKSSGLQFLPFNSIYQLSRQAALEPELLAKADHILMLPDLIGFLLTGQKATERTNASSTGLLNATTREWDGVVGEIAEVPVAKFPPLADAGEILGELRGFAGKRFQGTKVVLVGSHDTASAVVAVPSQEKYFAYLSSGTWSLLGTELEQPILTPESREANFTNELGVDGKVRYLKNLSGLWLLSECVRKWELDSGERISLAALLHEASMVQPEALFEVSDSAFVAPDDMPEKIVRAMRLSGKPAPRTRAEFVATILHSLASSYSSNLERLEDLTGLSFDALHVIGGGSNNQLLCQLTANYTGRKVIAGPTEATGIGNLLIQARSAGEIGPNLVDARRVVNESDFERREFTPQ